MMMIPQVTQQTMVWTDKLIWWVSRFPRHSLGDRGKLRKPLVRQAVTQAKFEPGIFKMLLCSDSHGVGSVFNYGTTHMGCVVDRVTGTLSYRFDSAQSLIISVTILLCSRCATGLVSQHMHSYLPCQKGINLYNTVHINNVQTSRWIINITLVH